MIMDVLGVLIAFTSIILLLSIIVTSLVQLTQALLKLRSRNLLAGVAALLRLTAGTPAVAMAGGAPATGMTGAVAKTTSSGATGTTATTGSERPAESDWSDARKLLNTIAAGNLRPARDPNSTLARVLGPTVSWIDKNGFLDAAGAIGRPVANAVALENQFKVIEAAMAKRFLLRMRLVATFWAAVVAFVFQVSAPQYVRDLWSNPEARRQLEAAAASVLSDAEEAIRSFDSYEEAGAKALERLAAAYPDSRVLIEAASGIGTTKDFIVDELELVVESAPNRAQLLADYERFLDEERLRYIDDLATTAGDAGISLAALRIEPWSERSTFYVTAAGIHWRHLGGVLITAMLLVLGAPFWFNALKTLTNLRDAMKQRLAG